MSKTGKTVKGAVPCGNPSRYAGRDVVRMSRGGAAGVKRGHAQDGEDCEETEGEKHLKTMLHHQLQTDITVSKQFSKHRDFTPATSHAPEVEKLEGVHKLDHYRVVEATDAQIDELRHCGLTDEEIALKLAHDMKDELGFSSKGYGTDPEVIQSRLREIKEKIAEKQRCLSQPDTFKGALELSRQAMDINKSLAQRRGGGEGVDVPNVITTQKKFAATHPDDPVNHIPEMMNELEGKVEREPRRERRRRRKMERRRQYYERLEVVEENSESEGDEVDESLSDLVEIRTAVTEKDDAVVCPLASEILLEQEWKEKNPLSSPSSCPDVRERQTLVVEGQKPGGDNACEEKSVRQICTSRPVLTEDDIAASRLTLEEIKQMDKFQNYSVGEPSKVVYVKNLPAQTKEEDLLSLFGLFQKADGPKVIFKLLTGRMRGQAFITFPDEIVAGRAIDLVNGYKLKGQPVILSYGKRRD